MQKLIPLLGITLLSSALSAQGFLFSDQAAVNDYLPVQTGTGAAGNPRVGPPSTATNAHILDAQKEATTAAGYTTNGGLGVTKDNLLGHLWVSFRRANTSSPHKLVEFWWDPTLSGGAGGWDMEVYDQPASLSGSAWGIRDMTSGSVIGGNQKYIYGSLERSYTANTVFAFDVTKQAAPNQRKSIGWTPAADWKTTGVNSGVTAIRALAYHPIRNTMFAANWSSDVVEFDKAGNQINQWTSRPAGMGTYGMAYCEVTHNIIAVGQLGSGRATDGLVAYVFDPGATKTTPFVDTGVRFLCSDQSWPHTGTQLGGIAGGCELIWEEREIPTLLPNVSNKIRVPVLYALTQSSSDAVICMYGKFQHNPYNGTSQTGGNTGGDIGMNKETPYLGNAQFKVALRNSTATTAILYASLGTENSPAAWVSPGSVLQLNASPGVFVGQVSGPVPLSGGAGDTPLPIPNIASLDGLSVFFQWVEITGGNATLSAMGGLTLRK